MEHLRRLLGREIREYSYGGLAGLDSLSRLSRRTNSVCLRGLSTLRSQRKSSMEIGTNWDVVKLPFGLTTLCSVLLGTRMARGFVFVNTGYFKPILHYEVITWNAGPRAFLHPSLILGDGTNLWQVTLVWLRAESRLWPKQSVTFLWFLHTPRRVSRNVVHCSWQGTGCPDKPK